ncbi:MAG: Lrp/AsnC ligand binding domain-containing protein [Euryarchaeota archaeon]|nr:Lrp/AsnC ligand binding domain-containing protein [Euryarchaeota archaeon]MBT4408011.1 Lrp/AsnC ligand binding domain-containing protein [Euryarchaeota archaeon]MBT6645307.1 Lrp/AsnC ligand binding domain-containing protein [Euryarchaeota archaeon]
MERGNMPEAFILIKTQPAREMDVYQVLQNHEMVVETHALYGEFDLLSRVSAENQKDLTKILMTEFRQISGVKETRTLIAVDY